MGKRWELAGLRTGNEHGIVALGSWGAVAIFAVAGAGIGLGAGATGSVDLVRPTTVLAADAVDFYDCPDGAALGDLHRGDRAYATARDESGDWLEVRSPHGPGGRVWIEARYAVPDGSTDDLPVVDCDAELLAAPGQAEETADGEAAAAEDSVTTTTTLGLPGPGGAPAPGSPDAAPGPGGPVDTIAPTIGSIGASPGTIQEVGEPGCPTTAGTSSVSAAVNDDVAIASVTISWNANGKTGSVTQSHGSGTYAATIGNFPADTIPLNTTYLIGVTFTATDTAGNAHTQSSSGPLLQSCGTV